MSTGFWEGVTKMSTLAARTSDLGTSLVVVKEELEITDDEEEVPLGEGEGEEPIEGEGEETVEEMMDFDVWEDNVKVEGQDPLQDNYDEFFEENVEKEESDDEIQEVPVEIVKKHVDIIELDSDDSDMEITEAHDSFTTVQSDNEMPIITSVGSLREERIAGSRQLLPAQFSQSRSNFGLLTILDIFRCFLCRKDFGTFDDFLTHRTKTQKHSDIPYDPEVEKSFCCGVCQKPWNQPRKALACAMFGHEPSTIQESMFIHSCPICPENHLGFHSLAAVGRHWALEHPERKLPEFLMRTSGNDHLPSIKLNLHHYSMVAESMLRDNPNLVLENFSRVIGKPVNPTKGKVVKIFRCCHCQENFQTRMDVEIHQCSKRLKTSTPTPAGSNKKTTVYSCYDCGKEFQCGRNFRLHLLRAGACKTDFASEEEYPFKCMICSVRFITYKSFLAHRLKAHQSVPYSAAMELPYACKICKKPAFLKKEAMICALFGHDPSTLHKAMFRFKCNRCTSFGFHSSLALKRHVESTHPNLDHSLISSEDKPLPNVYIRLDQLLSLRNLKEFGSALVIERKLHPSLLQYMNVRPARPSEKSLEEAIFHIEDDSTSNLKDIIEQSSNSNEESLSTFKSNENSRIIFNNIKEESISKNMCLICNKACKDIRRHMKIHDATRFTGPPTQKCVCGKEYFLRNSLHSHWKKNQECKRKTLAREKGELPVQKVLPVVRQVPPETERIRDKAYTLRIPSPTHEVFEDPDIEIEYPEFKHVPDQILNEVELPQSISIEPAEAEDLYSAYEKLDVDAASPAADESFDLSRFIHLDVEEVVEEDPGQDDKLKDSAHIVSSQTYADQTLKPLRPAICKVCNIGFASEEIFNQHFATVHRGSSVSQVYPYRCNLCGKRFKLKEQLKVHVEIHNPGRFDGEPKFACDFCGKKYHLKNSMESHRKSTHLGYVRPRDLNRALINDGKMETTNDKLQASSALQDMPTLVAQKSQLTMDDDSKASTAIVQSYTTVEVMQKDSAEASSRKQHTCPTCGKSFPKPCYLQEHILLHTGVKPHVCDKCGKNFRLKSSFRKHKLVNCPKSTVQEINSFKCCVCGLQTFTSFGDLVLHRTNAHKNIPFDKEKEKPFGCGVCQKPFFLKSQAVVCASLGHDPTSLRKFMFKHKCPECPSDRFGYHSLNRLKAHWLKDHPNLDMPSSIRCLSQNAEDNLPSIMIDKEKAREIREKGPLEAFDFPLFLEFENICPEPTFNNESPPSSPPTLYPEPPCGTFEEEDLLLTRVITRAEALFAVRALVVNEPDPSTSLEANSSQRKLPEKRGRGRPRKDGGAAQPATVKQKKVVKKSTPSSSVALSDRALGNKRIANILEKIRTARARKAALKESLKSTR